MAITNHNQDISIYQMVLDRLPFVIDDSNHIFELTPVSVSANTVVIANDITQYLRKEYRSEFLDASKVVLGESDIQDFSFVTPNTSVTYYAVPPTFNITGFLKVIANFNEQLISRYIFEVMNILQGCFQKADSEVGDEQYYSELQKIIIAELVSYYIVLRVTAANAEGNSQGGSTSVPIQKYIKTAQAEGISTTWEYLNIKSTQFLSLDAQSMMNQFKDNAACYGKQLNCTIEICGSSVVCSCSNNSKPILGAFRVARKLPCNCRPKRGRRW